MQIRVLPALKISMTIIGTTIGAGFASGREIWEFFGSYGPASHLALPLSLLLFFGAGMIILNISWRYRTENYAELLVQLMGKRCTILFDWLILFYLVTTTIVMLAGSGAIFEQWEHSFLAGCLLLGGTSMIVLFLDVKGLLSINTFLMPILVVILLVVFCQFLQQPTSYVTGIESGIALPAWPSAIAYAAFNIISLVAVLATMGQTIKHQSEIWLSGIISFIILGVIAFLYNICLLRAEHLLSQYEIPLFALVQNVSPLLLFAISLVLWLAIYTTTISNLHGFTFRLAMILPWPRWLVGLIILLLLIPVARIGFSALVGWLYPLYGVLNLFLLAVIWLYPLVGKMNHSS